MRELLRPALKAGKLHTLDLLKSLSLLRRFRDSAWRRRRLLILCYHGLSLDDEHEWKPSMYLRPAVLRSRFEVLRDQGYAVLPLDEALRRLYERSLPPRSVTLTFDDGTHDFYEAAWPLLREFGFPATVYLTTYYCERQYPVFPMLWSYLFWKARGKMAGTRLGTFDLTTYAGGEAAAAAVAGYARDRRMSQEEKLDLSRDLAAELGVDYEATAARRILHIMRPAQVAEIAAAGVDIQLHTHRHRVPLDRALFHREIAGNRDRIHALTGRDPSHFCYPSGLYHAQFFPWLSECGVRSATTCVPGLATPASPPFLTPRYVDTSRVLPIEFEAWLSGAGALLPRLGVAGLG